MSKHNFQTEFDIGGNTVDLWVTYTCTPGTPDVYYLRNGDPGYPGDPPEMEIESIKWAKTPPGTAPVWHEIKDEALFDLLCNDEWLEQELWSAATVDDEADRADYEYDRRRDEAMESRR